MNRRPVAATLRSVTCRLAMGGATCSLFVTKCLAQDAPGGATFEVPKSYVYSYAAVLLSLALGLFVVCQPRNREESIESRMDLAFSE
jgi:hypothetical protein